MSIMYFVAFGSVLALAFAASKFYQVKREPPGTEEMVKISNAVSNGASAYLRRQYKGVAVFFVVIFAILIAMAFMAF